MTSDETDPATLHEGAGHLRNEVRTCEPSDTGVTQPVHESFAPDEITGSLTRLRNRHGHNTAIGHRATNTLEQLENYPPDWIDYLEPDGVKERRRNLNKSIGRSLTELSKLTAA